MRFAIPNNLKTILTDLLVLLFICYYVNCTMFWHSHIINNHLITHSHFYTTEHTASADGGHSANQVHLIELLSDVVVITTVAAVLPFVFAILLSVITVPCRSSHHFTVVSTSSLRAPPSFAL